MTEPQFQKIECVIKPFKLDEVRAALLQAGVTGMTAIEVKGFGRQRGHSEIFRGSEYATNFLPKMKIEIIIPSKLTKKIIDILMDAARTGDIGDGKIFIHPISDVYRIRTGENGEDAV